MERKNIKTANFLMWLGFCLLVISLVLAPVIALFTGAVNLGDGGRANPSAYYTILGSFIGLSVLLLVSGFFLKRKFKKFEIEQGISAPAGNSPAAKTGGISLGAGILLALLGTALYFTPSLGLLPYPTYMLFYVFGGGWIGVVLMGAGIILIVRGLILRYMAKKI